MGLVCLKGLFAVCNSFIFSLPKVLSLIDQDRNCVINWSWWHFIFNASRWMPWKSVLKFLRHSWPETLNHAPISFLLLTLPSEATTETFLFLLFWQLPHFLQYWVVFVLCLLAVPPLLSPACALSSWCLTSDQVISTQRLLQACSSHVNVIRYLMLWALPCCY